MQVAPLQDTMLRTFCSLAGPSATRISFMFCLTVTGDGSVIVQGVFDRVPARTGGQALPAGTRSARKAGAGAVSGSPEITSSLVDEARLRAIEERRIAARRPELLVRPGEAPFLRVEGGFGFGYRVHLRGDTGGPHSCECPDFEANRLHTCKHVERVRVWLASPRSRLPRDHRRKAAQSRIYLHFGETVEPPLFGIPAGPGSLAVRRAFDGQQAADVVVNLDLPWNPARREQRIARVHRIGSRGAVQELLLVTRDSIEERILKLHETKREVLANIWDKGDADVIAAPGGTAPSVTWSRQSLATVFRALAESPETA